MKMTTEQWAARFDRAEEYANWCNSLVWAEESWARSLGFDSASDYHREADEAFATEQEYVDHPDQGDPR